MAAISPQPDKAEQPRAPGSVQERKELQIGLESDELFDIARLIRIARRRGKAMALASGLTLIPIIVFVWRSPDVYEATARVAIEGTPEVMELGPDFMPSSPVSRRRISTGLDPAVALVSSDAVLGRVIETLPPPPEIGAGTPGPGAQLGTATDQPPLTAAQERHRQIQAIRGRMTLTPEGGGTVLAISANARSPEFAAFLVNSVAEEYVDYRQEERREALHRATVWLGDRVLEVRGKIERDEEALAELVAREGIETEPLVDESAESRGRLVEELRDARIDLITVRNRLKEIEPVALEAIAQRASDPGAGQKAIDREALEAQRAQNKAELEAAKVAFTPEHPEVRRLERILASLDQELLSRKESGAGAGTGDASMPVDEALLSEYRTLKADQSRLEVRVSLLGSSLRELETSRDAPSPGVQASLDRLERELAINREMLGILLRRRNETMLAAATEHPDARVLDRAVPPVAPSGPNRLKWLLAGGALALGLGAGLGLLRELLDRRVREGDKAAELLGMPLLGVIPKVSAGEAPEKQSELGYSSPAAESYRHLRTSLLFAAASGGQSSGNRFGTLLVTSGIAGEGKTTVSVNLARSFARAKRKVVLVDADLRRPRASRILKRDADRGLAEVLAGDASLDECVAEADSEGFDLLATGELPVEPSELLESAATASLLATLRERYDVVIIDAPVLLAVPDARQLAALVDQTLVVYRAGSLDRSGLSRIRTELGRAGARVAGFVISHVEARDQDLYPAYLESPYVEPKGIRWRGTHRRRARARRA